MIFANFLETFCDFTWELFGKTLGNFLMVYLGTFWKNTWELFDMLTAFRCRAYANRIRSASIKKYSFDQSTVRSFPLAMPPNHAAFGAVIPTKNKKNNFMVKLRSDVPNFLCIFAPSFVH